MPHAGISFDEGSFEKNCGMGGAPPHVPPVLWETLPFCRGVGPPNKFSKIGALTGPQLLEGGCWERGGDFFQGVAIFVTKIN